MENKTVKSSDTILSNYHLVRGMDLNHHNTLFAGKAALLFVEAGFIVTSLLLETQEIVCLRIHGMLFRSPVRSGDTIRLTGQVVHAGRSSVGIYVKIYEESAHKFIVDGFLTFVRVDEASGRPLPHGVTVEIDRPEDREVWERYMAEKDK